MYDTGMNTLGIHWDFRSIAQADDNTVTPGRDQFEGSGFTVSDLRFTLDAGKTAIGDLDITAGVSNIFNKEYEEPFFSEFQPGRAGFAAVQLKW